MKRDDTIQAGLVLACGAVAAAAGQLLSTSPRERDIDGAVGVLLSMLGAGTVGLWVLALGLAVVAELLQRRGPSSAATIVRRCTPAVMRRIAAGLLGVNLLAVPTLAQAASSGSDGSGRSHAAGILASGSDPLAADDGAPAATGAPTPSGSPYWSPIATAGERSGSEPEPVSPSGEPSAAASAGPHVPTPIPPAWEPSPIPAGGSLLVRPESRTTAGAAEVVVASGDSLWSIVAGRLGPLATAADVAEAWPAWYDTNRAIVGEDPSFLLPGQVLKAPAP
ncbi:LysM peptidoglycan-binding domain-containing protein [Arthrobacter agilis]|uniref:LysM peptidoglycan-binding domain-containing protein n=1 Tax=Arthrobacter agilis TaxID=37921 RepID=UPI0027872EE9|nr:hypothetical protein [Arthrobacter agilis]MDQ0735534.1 hypothetical protein [Arthrobacter agilis]